MSYDVGVQIPSPVFMEDYPSLAEGNGLENRQVGQTTQEFESLILLFIIAG